MGLRGPLLSEEVVLAAPGSEPGCAFGAGVGCLGRGRRHGSREHCVRALRISRGTSETSDAAGLAIQAVMTQQPPGLFVVFKRTFIVYGIALTYDSSQMWHVAGGTGVGRECLPKARSGRGAVTLPRAEVAGVGGRGLSGGRRQVPRGAGAMRLFFGGLVGARLRSSASVLLCLAEPGRV